MGRSFYLIDSIKGGCGKTTFAIMLTQYLEQIAEADNHTVLLDFDFLGTGLINLFLTKDQITEFEKNHKYVTDKIRGFKTEDAKYICDCTIEDTHFYVAFGNPEYMTKHAYRLSSKFNYTPVINYGIFRRGIQSITHDEAELKKQLRGNIKNVVIDMSPGMDPYSEAIKESFFDKRHSLSLDKEDTCTYVLMMGMDPSHVAAAKNYFRLMMESDDKIPDKIYLVINDPMGMANRINPDKEVETYNALMVNILSMPITMEYRERIEVFVLNCFEEYAKHVYQSLPIASSKSLGAKSLFLPSPFKYWCGPNGSVLEEIRNTHEDMGEIEEWKKWLKK